MPADSGIYHALRNGKTERMQFAVICILGAVAMACVIGIVIMKVQHIDPGETLTAALCTSIGALTGILVHPAPQAHKPPYWDRTEPPRP